MPPFRCFLTAWVGAWLASFFLPSVAIAFLGLSPAAASIATGLERLPATSWKVADDVGPAVKLTIGAGLLVGFLLLERLRLSSRPGQYAISAGIGMVAAASPLVLVPLAFSRGFGAALSGQRFDAALTALYLLGGLMAGAAYAFGVERCRRSREGARRP